jgi:hypothetical protein
MKKHLSFCRPFENLAAILKNGEIEVADGFM